MTKKKTPKKGGEIRPKTNTNPTPAKAQPRTTLKKREFIEAMKLNAGLITQSCEVVGLSRSTVYDWRDKDPVFEEALQEIQEANIDFVEGKMFELINGVTQESEALKDHNGEPIVYQKAPDGKMIQFYLDRKARHRGYTEKKDINISAPEQIQGFIFK